MQTTFTIENITLTSLTLAAILAGRPLPEDADPALATISREAAFTAADAAFRAAGVTDKAGYLAWRDETRSGLRETAAEIRGLKARIRPLNGEMSEFWSVRKDLQEARDRFAKLHDARVFGKAWAGAARVRALSEARAA